MALNGGLKPTATITSSLREEGQRPRHLPTENSEERCGFAELPEQQSSWKNQNSRKDQFGQVLKRKFNCSDALLCCLLWFLFVLTEGNEDNEEEGN